jgi:hypothetical protein
MMFCNDVMSRSEFRGQCGAAMPRNLAVETPAWVIARFDSSIEPCGVNGNGRVDGRRSVKGYGWSRVPTWFSMRTACGCATSEGSRPALATTQLFKHVSDKPAFRVF